MDEKYFYVCFTPTWEHMSLIYDINDLYGGQDMGQQAALQQAMAWFIKLGQERPGEIESILRRAARTKTRPRQDIGEAPKSLKVRVEQGAYDKAEKLFMDTFGLVRIRRPYFARVILMVYYLRLLEENRNLGVNEIPNIPSSVTGSESAVCQESTAGFMSAVKTEPTKEEKKTAETRDKLQRMKLYGVIADILLGNAPEDEGYIQEMLAIAKRRSESEPQL